MPEKLGIVIVNWNNAADTLRCLSALYTSSYRDYTVVVVDNGSADGSVQRLRQAEPEIAIIESPVNLGYTGGNNLGIAFLLQRGVEYLLLLNDDAVVDENMLPELVRAAEDQPSAGMLGPLVYTLENREVLLSAGGIVNQNGQARHLAIGQKQIDLRALTTELDFLSGCALMVKRSVIEQIGLLDDQFFAYFEEVDWCRRAKLAGYKIRLVPTARVYHPDTRYRDQDSTLVTYYITRNSLLFTRKNRLGFVVTFRLLAGYSRQWLSWRIRPKWRGKAEQRRALASALSDFLCGRSGKWLHSQ